MTLKLRISSGDKAVTLTDVLLSRAEKKSQKDETEFKENMVWLSTLCCWGAALY